MNPNIFITWHTRFWCSACCPAFEHQKEATISTCSHSARTYSADRAWHTYYLCFNNRFQIKTQN